MSKNIGEFGSHVNDIFTLIEWKLEIHYIFILWPCQLNGIYNEISVTTELKSLLTFNIRFALMVSFKCILN